MMPVRAVKAMVRWGVRAFLENVGPIRVLFYVSNEIGFANQKALLELLAPDRRFRVGVCAERGVEIVFSDHELGAIFERYRLPNERATKMPWHYVFTTDIIRDWFFWDFVGVILSHGSCIANLHKSDEVWNFKMFADHSIGIALLAGFGDLDWLSKVRRDLLDCPSKAFFVCGAPKLAELVEKSCRKNDYVNQLGLSPQHKTLLVSSHWTRMSFLRDLGAEGVRALCARSDPINVIVTAHPKLWTLGDLDGFDGKGLLRELKAIESTFPNLRVVETGVPFELMAAADLMVCDHSSIRVEFARLRRPAALYRSSQFVCQSEVTDRLYRDASEVFSDTEGLDEAVSAILAPGYDMSEQSDALGQYFVADIFGAVGTIRNVLLRCGRVSSVQSRKWARVKAFEREFVGPARTAAMAHETAPHSGGLQTEQCGECG